MCLVTDGMTAEAHYRQCDLTVSSVTDRASYNFSILQHRLGLVTESCHLCLQ